MKITKLHLDEIRRCYCASYMEIDGNMYAFLGSEDPSSPMYAYKGPDFKEKELVWDDRGGCMSLIPFKERKGEFLAVNEFYLKQNPSNAKIVWGKKKEKGFEIKELFNLPYVHRFDIYHENGEDYGIFATIAHSKTYKDDWQIPGGIYYAKLPKDLNEPFQLTLLIEGLYRNHGYCKDEENGEINGYFGSDQGLLKVNLKDGKFSYEKILDGQIGEIALCDLDNDGNKELLTIQPFHGNSIKLYKKIDDVYKCVWEYDNEIDFAHTLVGCKIRGVNSFVAGIRRKDCELFILQYVGGNYQVTIVDKGQGPSNVAVYNYPDFDVIISANHTSNEAAIYKVEE